MSVFQPGPVIRCIADRVGYITEETIATRSSGARRFGVLVVIRSLRCCLAVAVAGAVAGGVLVVGGLRVVGSGLRLRAMGLEL